jgi:hypothetical protein
MMAKVPGETDPIDLAQRGITNVPSNLARALAALECAQGVSRWGRALVPILQPRGDLKMHLGVSLGVCPVGFQRLWRMYSSRGM